MAVRRHGSLRALRPPVRRPRRLGNNETLRNQGAVGTGLRTATINNAGAIATPPTVEFAGPAGSVLFARNVTDGSKTVTINITLGSGETLVIDFAKRTAKVGTTDHTAKIDPTSKWWELRAGNNTIEVSHAATVKHRVATR